MRKSVLLLFLVFNVVESRELKGANLVALRQENGSDIPNLQPIGFQYSSSLTKYHQRLCFTEGQENEDLKTGELTSLVLGSIVISKEEEEFGCLDVSSLVGDLTWQFLEPRIRGCQFVLMTRDSSHPFVSRIVRKISMEYHPMIVLDFATQQYTDLLQSTFPIWGSVTVTCRTFLIDLTGGGDEEMFSFLETNKFYEKPDSRVLMVGPRRRARSAIANETFRNNIDTLYLGLQEGAINRLLSESRTSFVGETHFSRDAQELLKGVETTAEKDFEDRVSIYIGCLYCDYGQTKVLMKGSWSLGSKIPLKDIIPIVKEVKNLHGYLMRIISITFTPYADYIQNKDGPGGIVTLLDSLDKRLIETFAPVMNFSFVVKSPPDMSFGSRLPDGSWTGVHGAIYRKEADFTTSVGPSSQRLEIVEYERTVSVDQLVIVSLKPQPLPQYLVFLRPFTVGVWVCLLLAIMIWGTTFWLLQKIRSNFTGEEHMTFNSAIFYSWTVILEDPPVTTPNDISSQMLLGWWLIACFLLMSGFKSSLVAHLAIVAQSEPIDTYRDLVTQSNWKWGIEDRLLTGMVIQYFAQNVDPDVRYIYQLNEKASPAEGLKRVLEGRFSYLITKNRITTIIGQIYKKEVSETQFYLGKRGYAVASALGWGVRRGAPFRPYVHTLISRLIASGIMDYWVEDVVHLKILQSKEDARHDRLKRIQDPKQDDLLTVKSEEGNARVLRMVHMMGVFLVLICGLTIATIIFWAERIIQRRSRNHGTHRLD